MKCGEILLEHCDISSVLMPRVRKHISLILQDAQENAVMLGCDGYPGGFECMHSGTQRDKLGSPQYADNDDSSSGCSFVSLTLCFSP